MKYLIITFIFLSAPIFAKAVPEHNQKDCISCDVKMEGNPATASELESIRKIASATAVVDYRILGSRICGLYVISRNLTGSVKTAIYDFIKEKEKIANPSPADVLRLLNKHKNELTCAGKNAIAKSFEYGKYNEILLDLFTGELFTEEVRFDFNAITYTKNPTTGIVEPMTVLDFIEKVALKERSMSGADSSKREINGIKDLLIEEFSAKRFEDLPLEERQGFERTTASR